MEKIAVLGLGYVGLPVALSFARRFPGTVGFDVKRSRIEELRDGHDVTGEVSAEELRSTPITITDDPAALQGCTFFVVAVPTPVDQSRQPDLTALSRASETVGRAVRPGAIVVYESTVYPGVTEDVCGPIIERVSGLRCGVDFKLGYSPERINPGDREHTLERIVKVVSGQDEEALERVADCYAAIVTAGVHKASSIKVAEAAKVIENTQRDLNIALMNELALIFDRLNLRTRDVIAAASTKWNFLRFSPGLVGGHCIGVDPYYLTAKAEQIGYHPQVILAGRRINDGMGAFIAGKLAKLLIHGSLPVREARVGILGFTFKENVPDLRNSKVADILTELSEFGISPLVHDPLALPEEAHEEFGISLSPLSEFKQLEAVVIAVSHDAYRGLGAEAIRSMVRPGGVVIDVKSMFDAGDFPGLSYWSL